ncbi:hypothetical protein Cs7R123_63870 [Catellatospora sp. TT07R-123]|uniref:hypothetical protein n=1 Tax=Catellatospora sp. TT07R-123 TaxID=2733863 RepID=UPI001B0D1CA8|nr:hypothetical protein [Catellatospora sp. TT07R-123]GHJ49045.1 hypothetical protein Cs7R123_63870 [Catellatospora sp. TT07R-123]
MATIVGAVGGARHPEHSRAVPSWPDVTRRLRVQAADAALARLAAGRLPTTARFRPGPP